MAIPSVAKTKEFKDSLQVALRHTLGKMICCRLNSHFQCDALHIVEADLALIYSS